MVQWLMNHRQSYLAMMNVDIVEESLPRVWRVCHAQVVQAIVSVTWILWPMSIDHSPRRDGGDIIIMKLSNCRPCPICYGFSWLLWYWWYISGFFFCYFIVCYFSIFFPATWPDWVFQTVVVHSTRDQTSDPTWQQSETSKQFFCDWK